MCSEHRSSEFRVVIHELGVPYQHRCGVIATLPDVFSAQYQFCTLFLQYGSPGFLHQCAVHLLASKSGGHVGRVNGNDGNIAALVGGFQPVFLENMAQADVLSAAPRGNRNLFPGQSFCAAYLNVAPRDQHRACTCCRRDDLNRNPAHKTVHGWSRPHVRKIDCACGKGFVDRRAVGKLTHLELDSCTQLLFKELLVNGYQSSGVGHVGKDADANRGGFLCAREAQRQGQSQ